MEGKSPDNLSEYMSSLRSPNDMSGLLALVCSAKKLERDRGMEELQNYLSSRSNESVLESEKSSLKQNFLQVLQDAEQPWESRQGCLQASKTLIPYMKMDQDQDVEFTIRLRDIALRLLTDTEVRVRMEAGEIMGVLCAKVGPAVYQECKEYILSLVKNSLERQVPEDDASKEEQAETVKLIEKLGSGRRYSGSDVAQIFHDTAGWKCLETSMKCLQAMIEGCGIQFQPFVDQELLDLIFECLTHTNRFVRETGFYVCASIVGCGNQSADKEGRDSISAVNPIYTYGHQFSKHVGQGLSDNWSQVRLAAAVAARKFFLSLPTKEARGTFYPELLPRLCLNRYYMAEGVRLYSQETWRLVIGGEGRELVQQYMPYIVEYYVKSTESNNHAVREAACACIAELGLKIDADAVRSYVNRLLDTLVVCFQDDSWPVRDAACLASGNFILCFPVESKPALEILYPMFFRNLQDGIPSVRQGAASSIAMVAKAYGKESVELVVTKVREGLRGLENQPSESEKYGDLEKGPGNFGVVKRLRDNDPEIHTNQQMYSCGSLAPKMNPGSVGCAMDRKFQKAPEPWELADGCVYLVAELSQMCTASSYMTELVAMMSDACRKRHYTHHLTLLETICKQIPVIAKGMGKRAFKPHIELLIEPIFYSLASENMLTSTAAAECLNQLAAFLGQNVLRARVEQFDSRYLQSLDAHIVRAPQ